MSLERHGVLQLFLFEPAKAAISSENPQYDSLRWRDCCRSSRFSSKRIASRLSAPSRFRQSGGIDEFLMTAKKKPSGDRSGLEV
jgi:hypothetical protein